MQTPIAILVTANQIARKCAYQYCLRWQTLSGPAFEAVLAAEKSWRPGGKSLEDWAEGYLRATIRKEMGYHKAYKGRATYVSLDAEACNEDGDGISNHELIAGWSGAEEIEETLKEREVAKPIKGMSPRLRTVADMLVDQGCSLTETGKRLGGYTPARIKQLQAKIAKGLRGVAAEGPQLALSIPQLNKAQGAPVKSCFGIPAEQVERHRRRGARVNGAAASPQMSMF